MAKARVAVVEGTAASGEFDVAVSDERGTSRHRVRLDDGAERKIAELGCTAPAFVEAAVRFLLDREPKETILSEFDLSVIARYFPEFDRKIGSYLA